MPRVFARRVSPWVRFTLAVLALGALQSGADLLRAAIDRAPTSGEHHG